jgi:hypothetical protein
MKNYYDDKNDLILSEKIDFLDSENQNTSKSKQTLIPKEILVTGPINAFRLEGKFDGVIKILYLFSGIYQFPEKQEKCESFEDILFPNYIWKEMKYNVDKNNEYDIFFEITKSESLFHENTGNTMYIQNFIEMSKEMIEEKKRSKIFDHVRLHHVDFRYLELFNIFLDLDFIDRIHRIHREDLYSVTIKNIELIMNGIINVKVNLGIVKNIMMSILNKNIGNETLKLLKENVIRGNIKETIDILTKIKGELNEHPVYSYFVDYLEDIITNEKYDAIPNLLDILLYFYNIYWRNESQLTKIFFNNTIFPFILAELDRLDMHLEKHLTRIEYLKQNAKQFGSEKMADHIDSYEYNKKIESFYFKNDFLIWEILSFCDMVGMDIYFVKRFLDKKYVRNSVIYAGPNHISRIIYFLVGRLDFKLTHISKIHEDLTIDTINKKIKDNDNNRVLSISKYLYPHGSYQCVDMSTFPQHFQ